METPAPAPGLGPWRRGEVDDFTPFPDEAVGGSIAGCFGRTAERSPEAPALSSPAGAWTYAELARDVERRARALAARVDRTEPTPVAVLVTHDGPLVVTILAVLAAGHVVVVLDPMAPADAVGDVLDESRPPLLVHDDALAALAADLVADRPVEAVDLGSLDEGPAGEQLPTRTAADPAMLAFTSGTSGRPKGAVITHGVILNLVRGATNALGIGPTDRMPMLFPTSLAVAAYPMFLPLLNGGTLATLDVRSVGLEPVADFLVRERITLAYMSPTVIRFLAEPLAGRDFPDLRMLALGGEPVDAEVVELTRSVLAPDRLANGYGTTETGVIALHVIEPGDDVGAGLVPTGHPVPDVEVLVLDEHGEPLPTGHSGEITVLSPHLFGGYWGHPELGAQVLGADPRGRPGWSSYRTGDVGHLDEHGELVVSGRLDTKVKIRGRFVVLADVEADLHQLEEVADAAVACRSVEGVNELVAYVVPHDDGLRPAELRARLLQAHEAYRVPSRWVLLDELPRLPNGKLDRRALPAPDDTGPDDTGSDEAPGAGPVPGPAPSPAALRTVVDVWTRMLPMGPVEADSDFFHLGGDSLLAAQMLIELERATGTIVPMGELVHARTPERLAEVLVRRTGAGGSGATACVQAGEAGRPRLWFVPDLQGSAYRVRHLAAALGPDQPVWSFESPLLAGEPNPHADLRSFATFLTEELLAAQPEGPYWLAGYSFGGICAYEMARQLVDAGHQVAFVGVVDVGPGYRGPGWHADRSPGRPWFGVAKPPPEGADLGERLRHYRDMATRSPKGAARHLMVRTGLARRVDPWRFRRDLRIHGRVRPAWRLWYAWEEHWKLAATAWDRASRYPGRMDLFWERTTATTDDAMGWGGLVDRLEIHRFAVAAGDHDAILEPSGAPALGAALRDVIDELLDTGTG